MKFRILFIFLLTSFYFYGQEKPNRFIVTGKVNDLLAERADCFKNNKTTLKFYHIQLYNGQSINTARSVKSDFQQKFPNMYVVIEWESPEFKVWAGEFETKLAADQALQKIRKEYPNAFIVNPKK
jgi:hypothetical protein